MGKTQNPAAEKTAEKQQRVRGRPFRPGESGNPHGRPRGARNRTTVLAQALLDEQAEVLIRQCIDRAMSGDSSMLRAVLERLVPPRKDAPVEFSLPVIETPADLPRASAAILTALAEGSLTPSEAQGIAGLLSSHGKSLEAAEIEERLAKLEDAIREAQEAKGNGK